MPFDISTAVEAEGQTNAVIPTTKFDISTAQEVNHKPIKSTPSLSGFLRLIMRTNPIEAHASEIESFKNLPPPEKGESFSQYQKRAKESPGFEVLKEREKDIIEQGVLRQVEAPMSLAIGAGGMAKPLLTAGMVTGFSIKDHFFNARRLTEEKAPNTPLLVKDLIEVLDLAATGIALGVGASYTKGFFTKRMSDINAPKSVQIEPQQVAEIQKSPTITEPLGIKPEQAEASINSNTPIQVPMEKVIDLALTGNWNKTKEKLGLGEKIEKEVKPVEEVVPDFKSTNEAFAYGEKATPEQVAALNKRGDELKLQSSELYKIPEEQRAPSFEQDALNIAFKKQFVREALQKVPTSLQKGQQEQISQKLEIFQPQASESQIKPTPLNLSENVPLKESIPPTTEIGKPISTGEPTGKERGFITSVKESEMVGKETKKGVSKLPSETTTYDVYSDKPAVAKAQERVANDPEGALTDVLTAQTLDKDLTVTGLELMRKYRNEKNTAQEVNIAAHLAQKGTEAGQFIQAFSILDKLSPEGILVFAQRELNKGVDPSKRKNIDPEFAEALKKQAQVIQDTPYGYQKVIETKKLTEMIAEKKGRTTGDWIIELANLPRSLTASFLDFSFGGRQGIFLAPTFPKEWASAFGKQFGAFAKEENFNALMDSILKHPDYQKALDSGVAFTDIKTKLSSMEEKYMGANIAEKIPIIGKGVAATNRAYVAMANKMRIDIFSRILKDYENLGIKIDKKLLQQTAEFVNAGTGRGGLGPFEKAAQFLNAFFFSPRLMASRLKLLYPGTYITMEKPLRKQALKSLFSFIGAGMTILTLAKFMGADVGTDPTSSDLGKIKIGKNNKTRIDIWGGFQQYVRGAAQIVSGKYTSSVTGKKMTLGEGYKPLTRYDILLRQIENKEAPVFSLLTDIMKQQNFKGEPVNIPVEVAQRFVPMVAQDMYELYKEDPGSLPVGLLGIFGEGIQSYGPKKSNKF